MFKLLPILPILPIFIALGCKARVLHQALDPALAVPQEVDGRSIVARDEVVVRVAAANLGSGLPATDLGGLVAALLLKATEDGITRSRATRAEALVEPLLDATPDFDFRARLQDAVDAALAQSSWMHARNFEHSSTPRNVTTTEIAERPFLALQSVHELSEDCRVLTAQAHVRFFAKGNKRPAYFGYLTYYSAPVAADGHEAAIAAWAENGGARYRTIAEEAIDDLRDMLGMDLLSSSGILGGDADPQTKVAYHDPFRGKRMVMTGTVLADKGNRIILRESGGNLFSLPKPSEDED
jgi:hypothetical protein